MNGSTSQTEVCLQKRCIQQVAICSKVQGKSAAAMAMTHATHATVDLLETSAHHIDSYVGHGCTWVLSCIAIDIQPAPD